MARVIILSRFFPAYHPRKGEHTDFVEKFLKSRLNSESELDKVLTPVSNFIYEAGQKIGYDYVDAFLAKIDASSPKGHTIREGHRFKAGDYFSPRIWSKSPYNYKRDGSKMITIAPDTLIVKTWDFKIQNHSFYINGREYDGEVESHHELLEELAKNDGLTKDELLQWFKFPNNFDGQIICWNNSINY